ncbi:peptidyl-alpha-hydroxyglycine alpha-amidating lyase family protein [Polystyrenella longa]|uniref:peptidyl-alpha-hydroxyglycine alpha-amidating lyase family protein n=1 Tax=Polystyrenella longa TaxID=2528007 RepID=UPI0018D211C8|nr:peptidyl-alpha-hydroxyglycine alpha-amidating lyase family protein [Polystyrenella longa]
MASSAQAQYPGFAEEPLITEYDIDESWPKRPDNLAKFGWVSGMAQDKEENIWLFNKGDDPVQCYTPDGEFVRTWGAGDFKDPHHIRIDDEGSIWVADFGLHIVQKYTPEGKLLMELGEKNVKGEDKTHFNMPTDMVIGPNGDIFVTDGYGNRRIVHFDKNGQYIKEWGSYGTGRGQFVLPHAIVMDKDGKLYVADRNSGRVMIFNQDGELLDEWSNIIMPWGMSINAAGDLWICGSSPHWWKRKGAYPEFKDQMFVRFNTNGRLEQVWTIPLGDRNNRESIKPGAAVGVHCIVEDKNGNLYVGDIYDEKAMKFVPVKKRSETEE